MSISLNIGGAGNGTHNGITDPFTTGIKIAAGSVIDTTGAVVAGVSVSMPAIWTGDFSGASAVDAEVDDFVESTHFRLGSTQNSSFVIHGLTAGDYQVTVYSNRGSNTSCPTIVSVNGQASQTIDGSSTGTYADRSCEFTETITASEDLTISVSGDGATDQARVSWILIEDLSAAGPTITGVSSAAGADTVALNSVLTVTLNNSANVTSVTGNGVATSNVTIVDANTVTAQIGLGVAANIGSAVDIVVNNGANSNAYSATVAVPAGWSFVTLAVDYANINTDSYFSGEAAYSGLVVGDALLYDNRSNILTIAGDLLETFNPQISAPTPVDFYFLDASDSYNADATITTVTYSAPTSAPVMPADTSVNVAEHNTAVGTFTASSGTAPITYSISGTDAAEFSIDANTGVVSLNAAANYEAKNSYAIVVTATNAHGSDSQNITVNITNVNEVVITDAGDAALEFVNGGAGLAHNDSALVAHIALFVNSTSNNLSTHPDPLPAGTYSIVQSALDANDVTWQLTVTESTLSAPVMPADTSVNVAEHNTAIGTFVADSGSAPITYTLSGTDAAEFSIGSGDGVLALSAAADYEVKTSYSVTVTATNAHGSDFQNVTVNVTNVNEVVIVDAGNASIEFANGGAGLAHNDPALATHIALFVNSTSNNLSTHPDPLPAGVYSIIQSAADADDVVWQLTVTESTLSAPVMPADTSASVVENNTAIGTFVADSGSTPITYTLSGTDAAEFSIGSGDGVLALNAAADYEVKTNYSVTVTATNAHGSDSQNITVNVTNVNEVVVSSPADITIEYDYGSAGLPHNDAALISWLATAVNAQSNDLSLLADPIPAGVNIITFTAADAADETAVLTTVEAAAPEDDAIIANFQVYPGISVATRRTLFPENTHVCELFAAKWAVAGSVIDDAIVSLMLRSGGGLIAGQGWPTVLVPVPGESGMYRAVLSHQMDLNNVQNGRVEAEVTIVKDGAQAKYNYVLSVQSRGA